MNQQIIWKPVNHPDILPGYLVSPEGYIKAKDMNDKDAIKEPSYHSTNGYDFMLLNNKDGKVQLFPIDDIIAMAYISIPSSLKDKPIKVSHINGNTRDITLDNLQWVEDIEEWKVCTYPGVKPNMYEVSSWGRIRNKKRNTILSLKHFQGYRVCTLTGNTVRVHRAVGFEFLPGYSKNKHINHIDGIKNNNYWKNLEWVTPAMNIYHSGKTLLRKDHISLESLKEIERLLNLGLQPIEVLECIDKNKFPDITYHSIYDSVRGRYNIHISPIHKKYKLGTRTKMNPKIADDIREQLIANDFSISKTLMTIKDEYPWMTYSMLKKLKYGTRYKYTIRFDLEEFNKLVKNTMKGKVYE